MSTVRIALFDVVGYNWFKIINDYEQFYALLKSKTACNENCTEEFTLVVITQAHIYILKLIYTKHDICMEQNSN